MSTIIHMPGETDTALDLFEGDTQNEHYQKYGHHGYPGFIEFARGIGLIEVRAARIIAQMITLSNGVVPMVNNSLLSDELKGQYIQYFEDKIRRPQLETV